MRAIERSKVRQLEERTTDRPRFAHESEAEFARLLDFYGIRWEYERRSFPLRISPEGTVLEAFTPDFYLPDLDTYIELTTLRQNLVTQKNRKVRRLRELYPGIKILLLYRRDYQALLAKYGLGSAGLESIADIDRVLITATDLERRVDELGAQISEDYANREPLLVGVLKGVSCFMADLMRRISLHVTIDYMAISSYRRDGDETVQIIKDLDEPIAGRDVILVEDIVDTGMTLAYLLQELRSRGPASLEVCALLDKRVRRIVDIPIKYVGFEIPDEFVVGYGLDYQQRYRNLPFIATLRPQALELVVGGGQQAAAVKG